MASDLMERPTALELFGEPPADMSDLPEDIKNSVTRLGDGQTNNDD